VAIPLLANISYRQDMHDGFVLINVPECLRVYANTGFSKAKKNFMDVNDKHINSELL
jgi:hypothetical protein